MHEGLGMGSTAMVKGWERGGVDEHARLERAPGAAHACWLTCSPSSWITGGVESACEPMMQTGLSTVEHAEVSRATVVGVMGMVLRGSLHDRCCAEAVCAAADLSEDPSCQQSKN